MINWNNLSLYWLPNPVLSHRNRLSFISADFRSKKRMVRYRTAKRRQRSCVRQVVGNDKAHPNQIKRINCFKWRETKKAATEENRIAATSSSPNYQPSALDSFLLYLQDGKVCDAAHVLVNFFATQEKIQVWLHQRKTHRYYLQCRQVPVRHCLL